ncbi:transposase [Micromonospora deserti]|uniref:transposase n=1 Tax=Micromonospora deserti TaxID=2070366 RepID=UPI00227960B8|nr:transposase [Micromonospora deserti]
MPIIPDTANHHIRPAHGLRARFWHSTAIPHLVSFANGLTRDRDAVITGLSLPYSSGRVEGAVNKIKMLKRQMFGRANTDLLRKRILLKP